MQRLQYAVYDRRPARSRRKLILLSLAALLLMSAIGFLAYKYFVPTSVERAVNKLQFDDSVQDNEKQIISDAIKNQSKTYQGSLDVSVKTAFEADQIPAILAAYVPVTNIYATRQAITKAELGQTDVYVPAETEDKSRSAIAKLLGLETSQLKTLSTPLEQLPDSAVAFVPASDLSYKVKLLALEDSYYLDNFQKGAIFRRAVFSGTDAASLGGLKLNDYITKDATLKVNMTGVTALTRVMMKKLNEVQDPKYFSQHIGPFLSDADITHVANEVSFRTGCGYSDTVFCSPPDMLKTLQDSGVDIVELTGNHNNDNGSQYNAETIKLYHSMGWHTFGGGLNTAEAAKPYIADQKESKIAFLGYNYADSPNSGAIAGPAKAGANSFNEEKVKADVATAKQQAGFVIVDVQFWECYSYPDGYVEFPVCDLPISNQKEVFRQIADLGADMVIGTQAHQPQTYEIYKGKPIYYGLGNLYFEQTSWPGTERGIVLTHYFNKGKLLQTKLSPTVYDKSLQPRLMNADEAIYLLQRLKTARESAGL